MTFNTKDLDAAKELRGLLTKEANVLIDQDYIKARDVDRMIELVDRFLSIIEDELWRKAKRKVAI